MLEQVINILAMGSLAFGGIAAYLHLNKLWPRKHFPEVAASISIPGTLVEALPTIVFAVYYLSKGEVVGFIDSLIWLTAAIGFILIGSGFWVKGQRKQGFWRLALRSVTSESHEVGNLFQSVMHPMARKELAALLQNLAGVDGNICQQESDLINEFCEQAGLNMRTNPGPVEGSRAIRMQNTRSSLNYYLESSPPDDQVERLQHLLHRLIQADGTRHADEDTIAKELDGMISQYLGSMDKRPHYRVLLAPQGQDQTDKLMVLLEMDKFHSVAGGEGVLVGEYYSREFADEVCREFRQLGYFTVVTDEAFGKPGETAEVVQV